MLIAMKKRWKATFGFYKKSRLFYLYPNSLSYITQTSDDILGLNPMFHLLIENNIDLTPSYQGLDPLNFSLMNVHKSNVAIYYTKKLVDYGAVIDNSHHQQMTILKLNNEGRYLEVIDVVPALELLNNP